jgi:hypothetical protein
LEEIKNEEKPPHENDPDANIKATDEELKLQEE